MTRLLSLSLAAAVCGAAAADEIRLTNGDEINGTIVSLDETSLALESENFGKMTIPREKVRLIALGEDGLPEPVTVSAAKVPAGAGLNAAGLGGLLGGGGDAASLQQLMSNPMVRQQLGGLLGEAMGGESPAEAQRRLNESRRGLKDLADDLGGIEGEAMKSYLKMFDVLGGGLGAAQQMAPGSRPLPEETVGRPDAGGR